MSQKLLIILVVFITCNLNAQIVINEVMSRNEVALEDFEGDTPDWIELYNSGDDIVSTDEIYLSDDLSNLEKWELPELELLPGEFLLVFASGKDIINPEFHCNFKLDGEGETLYLYDENASEYSEFEIPLLRNNQSYGRFPDGSELHIKMDISSPEYSNNMGNSISYSHEPGFYEEEFLLNLSSQNDTDTLYYTLDGSEPTQASTIITGEILIYDKSFEPNLISLIPTTPDQDNMTHKTWVAPNGPIPKAMVVRIASYRNGIQTSGIQTLSYFIGDGMTSKYSMPVISLTSDMLNLFNYDSGIYVPGVHFNPDNTGHEGNYFKRGEEWERDVHIEYFSSEGNRQFYQDAGMRTHGALSRQACQKSLRLYARKEYGSRNFEHPLFPNSPTDKHKRFLLRSVVGSTQWDNALIRDPFALNLCKNSDLELQTTYPVVVYLNGEYWGIHNVRERMDKYYISELYDCDPDSVVIMSGWNCPTGVDECASFDELHSFIDDNSMSDQSNYDWVKTIMDMDNYIDYVVCETFLRNYDWPGNNVKIWKLKNPDSKWRWLMYDFDHAFKSWEYNSLIHASYEGNGWPFQAPTTLFFRKFIENDEFVEKFKTRMSYFMNTAFYVDQSMSELEHIVGEYDSEMERHSQRFHHPGSVSYWKEKVKEDIEQFIANRPCEMWKHMQSFFDFEDLNTFCLSHGDSEINIFPNPANNMLSLSLSQNELLIGNIEIYTIEGKLVKAIDVEGSYHIITIDVGDLKTGLFVVRSKINQTVYVNKLFVE